MVVNALDQHLFLDKVLHFREHRNILRTLVSKCNIKRAKKSKLPAFSMIFSQFAVLQLGNLAQSWTEFPKKTRGRAE